MNDSPDSSRRFCSIYARADFRDRVRIAVRRELPRGRTKLSVPKFRSLAIDRRRWGVLAHSSEAEGQAEIVGLGVWWDGARSERDASEDDIKAEDWLKRGKWRLSGLLVKWVRRVWVCASALFCLLLRPLSTLRSHGRRSTWALTVSTLYNFLLTYFIVKLLPSYMLRISLLSCTSSISFITENNQGSCA